MKRAGLMVVGHGMASARLLADLDQCGFPMERITIIGDEPRSAYNRILLSSWLAGDVEPDQLTTHPRSWYSQRGIEVINSTTVTQLDLAQRIVSLDDGQQLNYEQLVVATGSAPARPQVPGSDSPGVISFRAWEDVQWMQTQLQAGDPVVVLGGGLLGLEAAYGLAKQGAQVAVIHRGSGLMNRQLDGPASEMLADHFTALGVKLCLATEADEIFTAPHQVGWVKTKRGESLPAKAVVAAMGVRPNIELAKRAGLACQSGIVVDAQLATSDPHVFALGECCQVGEHTFGLVAPIWEQSKALAKRLCQQPAKYQVTPTMTQLKIGGISIFSGGEQCGDENQSLTYHDPDAGIYRKLWRSGSRLTGAVMIGQSENSMRAFDYLSGEALPDDCFSLVLS